MLSAEPISHTSIQCMDYIEMFQTSLDLSTIVHSFREGRIQVSIGGFWELFQIMF